MADDPIASSFRQAALVAHQMRAPLDGVATVLAALLGDFAGPLNPKQREMLERAQKRCRQAADAAQRMLAIAAGLEQAAADATADMAAAARAAADEYREEASERGIRLTLEIAVEPALVQVQSEALAECCRALLANALKYTPDFGRIRLAVAQRSAEECQLCVSDSGIGIAAENREKIFEPFFRTQAAAHSARPGFGLGLSFVKLVAEKWGGRVWAEESDLGGAAIFLVLRAVAQSAPLPALAARPAALRVVIIGGRVAGPKIASRVIRLQPDAQVTVVERDRFLSYAGCGLPYYVAGDVRSFRELMATPAGAVRNPVFFQQVKNFRALNRCEALEIDRARKRVLVRDLVSREDEWLPYDKLVIASGSLPLLPNIPGADLSNVFTLKAVADAEAIRLALAEERARDVAVIGGGLNGVEITEALVRKGCRVTIIEKAGQILRILDWEMAKLVEHHLEAQGVRVLVNKMVERLLGDAAGAVRGVMVAGQIIPADMVIFGIGVRPNAELARRAGLAIGATGGILVDEYLRTSDPDIYAAGDCVECRHRGSGTAAYVPLGSTANRQGRVVAANICGRQEVFAGILGTCACKVFEYGVARTGLTEAEAQAAGYRTVCALLPAPDRDHYMPQAKPLYLKMVVDAESRRLLGLQAVGPGDGVKRIDAAAIAIQANMTVDDLAQADLCYAPAFAPAIDNLIAAAHVAANKLNGHFQGVSAAEVWRRLQAKEDFLFLDVRTPGEFEEIKLPGSRSLPLEILRSRLEEIPRQKAIVLFCSNSLRAYEASLILRHAGFENVAVLDGGLEMWPFAKMR
ncbi:MAG: FAD-dependent oxidoreductase [Planctomycetota bacterium]|nr:FAD-dependent oxidoreductase [Planctomycetota bacterium]